MKNSIFNAVCKTRYLALLVVLIFTCGNVWGAEVVAYTLTCPRNTSNSAYASTYNATISGIEWNAHGNQYADGDWRFGGKSITNTNRRAYSKTQLNEDITKIIIAFGAKSSSGITINSVKFNVYSTAALAAALGDGDVSTHTLSYSANSSQTITVPSGKSWNGRWYSVIFNVTVSGSDNKYAALKSITFYKEDAPSCTSISPSLSYASVGGTTLTIGSSSSGSPTITGNTGSGAVTYSSSDNDVATVNPSGIVTAVAAGNATITASIAANGDYCEGSATANFTITVPAYTVQFSTGTGNPTVSSRTEASGGAGITLPAGPTPACSSDGWVFFGWKETSAQSSSTTAPDVLAAGMTYKPASNCTLYAVYYKQADSNPNYYTKVTSSDNLTSGQYVIYANGEAMNNVITSSKIAGKSVSETSSGIISTTDADIIWTLYKNGTNYQLYNAGVSKYLEVTGENSLSLPTSSKGFTLNAFNTSTGQVSLKSVNKTSYQFQYYSGNFSAYGSQSTPIYFYKRGGTYNSNPTCCVQNTITKTGGGTATGGTFTTSVASACDGVSVTLTPTADPGYTFSNWTVTKTASPYTDITSSNVDGNTLTMPDYGVTVNATFTPTPTLTATGGDLSETTLSFGTSCEQDEGTDKTFVLNGYSLTNNVTLTIGGTDASMFSVKSPSSPIDKGTGRINDQTVTVTFTPTSTGAKTATLTIASSGASSIVLTLSGTAIKHYKVHYWNSGEDVHQESVLAGADATATWDGVDDEDGCDTETYKYFVGWSKTNVGSTPTTTKPTIGGTYTSVSADVNYYAVWTNVNPNGWERYESSTIAEGDYLFIQYYGSNYQALNNSISSNRMGANVATLSGGLITQPTQAVSYDWNDYIWHIAKPDPDKEEYTIYNADESKYIVSTGTASQIDFVASPSDGKELFTITYNSTTKKYVWTNKYNSTNSVNAVFRYGGSGFACYASTDHNLYLYYRAGGTAKYITNCCDKNVTLATNSPANGTITFSPEGPIGTCGADAASRQTTMTVTPDAGYYLSAWSTTGVTPYSVSPAIAYGSVSNSGAQATTVTFNQNTTTGTYTANATFTAIPVSSLSLRAQQTGQSDKTGSDLTMNCYPKEGQTGGNDPLNHSLNVKFHEVLPANALDKEYDWSVRVKATGAADWTNVGFTGNVLNNNTIINSYNKSTGNLQIKATTGTAEIKITAHDGSGVTAKVTITVANVSVSSISVDPTTMDVYAGQKKPVTITFSPANATDKVYTIGSYTYVTMRSSGSNPFYIEGNATNVVRNETVTVTSHDGSKTATIDVTVNPLPKATFIDIVHGKTDFLVEGESVLEDGTLTSTVSADGLTVDTEWHTPTHADVSDPGAGHNTCERGHLHLVGWILKDWADENPDATSAQIATAGTGNFYTAGSEIDLVAKDGKTFYAVWAKEVTTP